jgi:hypothetical protein
MLRKSIEGHLAGLQNLIPSLETSINLIDKSPDSSKVIAFETIKTSETQFDWRLELQVVLRTIQTEIEKLDNFRRQFHSIFPKENADAEILRLITKVSSLAHHFSIFFINETESREEIVKKLKTLMEKLKSTVNGTTS